MMQLPAIILQNPSKEYLGLLLEARELFVAGFHYSCVAMCGIVSERLVKDLFRSSILVQRNGVPEVPSDDESDQLEQVEMRGIVNFLSKAHLLDEDAKKAATALAELRNRYAHAHGKKAESDALKAIGLLHAVVEGTVSVFKDFQIQEGRFVLKVSK